MIKSIRQSITYFAKQQPKWFVLLLTMNHPLDMEKVEKFIPWLGLDRLSSNYSLRWSQELFLKYRSAMGYDYLPSHSREVACHWWIPELYQNHLEYYPLEVIGNENYWEWNTETIHQWAPLFDTLPPFWSDFHEDYCDYNQAWSSLCINSNVKWTVELLHEYKDRLNWFALTESLGLEWSEDEIMPFKELWHWPAFDKNYNIIWTENMIRYSRQHWRRLPGKHNYRQSEAFANQELIYQDLEEAFSYFQDFCNNPHIQWDSKLFDAFKKLALDLDEQERGQTALPDSYTNYTFWNGISDIFSPHFDWSEAFIAEHADQLNWEIFSANPNPSIPWSLRLIEQYQDRIDWQSFSCSTNPNIPWSIEFIERYQDRIDFGNLFANTNPLIPFSIELLKQYHHRIDYWVAVCENTTLPWSKEFLEVCREKWDWSELQVNMAIPWDWDLLLYFADEIGSCRGRGYSKPLWDKLFTPYLDDDFVEELLIVVTAILEPFDPEKETLD